MNLLEEKIADLLGKCEPILAPYILTAGKWEIDTSIRGQIGKLVREVVDERTSLSISWHYSGEKIKRLPSYIAASKAFQQDETFSKAIALVGFGWDFDAVLVYILTGASRITTRKISIRHSEALSRLRQLRRILTSTHLEYVATTRLFGIALTSKRMSLPDNVEITRLAVRERNNRQPLIHPYLSLGTESASLLDSEVELQLPLAVQVDPSAQNAFLNAAYETMQRARSICGAILDAILVAKPGTAMLGTIELRGGIEGIPPGQGALPSMPPRTNMKIAEKDISNIAAAYHLISASKEEDRTLARALRRFLLGRKRQDLHEKIVDYVIAWEAVLLTRNKKAMKQELSYRFSLNGASLLGAINKKWDRFEINKKMKAAYSVRSTIVHGGGNADIEKDIEKGGFDSLHALCDFLETNFRTAIFWLGEKSAEDRPYRKEGAWEELIWLR
ncbi:hypothetical protein [Petrachloros mirabilis]